SPPSDEQREGLNEFYISAKETSSAQSLGLLFLLQIGLSHSLRKILLGIRLIAVMGVLWLHSGEILGLSHDLLGNIVQDLLLRERLAYRKLDGTSIGLLNEEGEKALDRNLVVVEVI